MNKMTVLYNSPKLSMMIIFAFGLLVLGVTVPVFGQTSDTTPPVVTVPDDIVIQATSESSVPVTFSVSATDDVDGDIIPTCNYPSGFSFNIGTTDISCTAEDTAGNKTTEIFYITITYVAPDAPADTPPVITIPSDMTIQATSNNPTPVTYSVSASDDTDGTITPTCSPVSGSEFQIGNTTVTCTATDAAGNTTTESFTITVTYEETTPSPDSTTDTTPPVITIPSDMVIQATSNNPAPATFSVSASDDTDGTITPTCSPVSGSEFPIGNTTVTCTATDAAGNTTTESFTITVTYDETTPEPESKELGLASFVDTSKDPQSYVDRYNNEQSYKDWFDTNYPEYPSIYEAVGLEKPLETPEPEPVPDPEPIMDPKPVPDPEPVPDTGPICGPGTEKVDGFCQVIKNKPVFGECGEGTELIDGKCTVIQSQSRGGGCLIATATYGTELAPQVQQLRELRDHILQTNSGTLFIESFNNFYYSFSPYIADYERENPVFKEAVKIMITPMISSLSILNYVDMDSEEKVIGYGISLILLNLGMYLAAPAMLVYKARRWHNL